MKKNILIILLIFYFSLNAFAQNELTCSNVLNNIKPLFEDGHYGIIINEIPGVLQSCDLSKDDEIYVLKFYIAALEELKEDSLCDEATKRLLSLDPFYEAELNSDPEKLRIALLRYETFPRLSFGLQLGTNYSIVDRITVYTLLDSADYTLPYRGKIGFNANAFFSYNPAKWLNIGLFGGIYETYYIRDIPIYSETFNVRFTEEIFLINAGLFFRNNIHFRATPNFTPYIKYGVYVDDNTSEVYGNLEIMRNIDTLYQNLLLPPKTQRHIQIDKSWRNMREGVFGAIGFEFRKRNVAFSFEGAYFRDLNLYNNPEYRYQTVMMKDFFYLDSDIILSKIAITFAISYNFAFKVKYKY